MEVTNNQYTFTRSQHVIWGPGICAAFVTFHCNPSKNYASGVLPMGCKAQITGNKNMLLVVAVNFNRQLIRKQQKHIHLNAFLYMLPMLPIIVLKAIDKGKRT